MCSSNWKYSGCTWEPLKPRPTALQCACTQSLQAGPEDGRIPVRGQRNSRNWVALRGGAEEESADPHLLLHAMALPRCLPHAAEAKLAPDGSPWLPAPPPWRQPLSASSGALEPGSDAEGDASRKHGRQWAPGLQWWHAAPTQFPHRQGLLAMNMYRDPWQEVGLLKHPWCPMLQTSPISGTLHPQVPHGHGCREGYLPVQP